MFPLIRFFNQRTPRTFTYKPIYYREEEFQDSDSSQRLRNAFRGEESDNNFRRRLEQRRILPSVDSSRSKQKLVFWLILLGLSVMSYVLVSGIG